MSFWKYAKWLLAPITSLTSYARKQEQESKYQRMREYYERQGMDASQIDEAILSGSGFDTIDSLLGNASDKYLGTGLTQAEQEANAFSASEAQKGRDWEEYMSNTAYQRQVADMKAAGVNPAMAMSNGAGGASTPSGSMASSVSPGAGMSMSELVSLLNLPIQRGILKAQQKNIEADTDKKRAETVESENRAANIALINKFYPQTQEKTIEEICSRIGVNLGTISQKEAETALTQVKTALANKENDYADKFYKFRAEYEEAKTEEAQASALAAAARAAMDAYELQFAKKNGYRLSSSGTMALVTAICSAFGISPSDVGSQVTEDTDGTPQGVGRKLAGRSIWQIIKDAFDDWKETEQRKYGYK